MEDEVQGLLDFDSSNPGSRALEGIARGQSPTPRGKKFQTSMLDKQVQLSQSITNTDADEPLYVNPKQFHRILKRRVARQRLEEALRLTSKGRKPYLHTPRHDHRMQRPRGPGGRLSISDEVAEIERMGGNAKDEYKRKPAREDVSSSGSGPYWRVLQPRETQDNARSTADPQNLTAGSDSQVGREPPIASVAQEPVSVRKENVTEMGERLSCTDHMDTRGRTLARSRSLSISRSTTLSEWIVAPRSRSAGTKTSIELFGSITRSNSGTDEEESWWSEEETTSQVLKLSGDQRNYVKRVMETFWDVMNKNWRSYVRERTAASGAANASSAAGNSQETSLGASTALAPSQKSLGKRAADDDERDDEERPPKRSRNNPNSTTDPLEKIKLSCPYRKRNRQKYNVNVHTYRTCALTGFPDIARVKEHLYRTHRAPIQCHRCALVFKDQQELKTHSRAKTSCELKEGDPVEGFDNDVFEKLKRRKKASRDQPVEARWREIYCLLFPEDDQDNIPSPFWEPPVDEPPPTSIALEDYIRQEVPRRVRMHIEDRLAAGDYSYDLAIVLSNQMMEIFEEQIDSCILEHRAKVMDESQQKTDPPTPPVSSSRSPAVSAEQPATEPLSSSTSVPQSMSGVPEDWFTTYLQSGDAPWDPLLPFP